MPTAVIGICRGNSYKHFMLLEAASSAVNSETIRDINATAQSISLELQNCGLDAPPSEVAHIILAIQCNAHRIVNQAGQAVTLGIFPMTCMMNHSCTPNTEHHFELAIGKPPQLVMRALQDIEEGTELCYSYVPLFQSTAVRGNLLRKAYSFDCSCRRCSECSNNFFSEALCDRLYPVDSGIDGIIAEPGEQAAAATTAATRLLKEIEVCIGLSTKPLVKGTAFKRLLSLMNDRERVNLVRPECKHMLQAYVCIGRTGLELAESAPEGGKQAIREAVFVFSCLAIGIIYYYTRVQSSEVMKIVSNVFKVCKSLGIHMEIEEDEVRSAPDRATNLILQLVQKYMSLADDSETTSVILNYLTACLEVCGNNVRAVGDSS